MHLQKQLTEVFHLTSNEAALYLYGLSRVSFAAQDVARDTGIPRPTVYHILQTLVQKGLLTKMGNAQRATFTSTHPRYLPSLFEQETAAFTTRQESLATLLPSLMKELKTDSHTNYTKHYEGLTGIKLLFEEALYCKNRAWNIIAPSQNVLRQVEPTYAAYVYETQKRRGIQLKTLWEDKPHTTKHSPEEIARRNIRLMPEAMTGKFSSLIILFDDACAFFPPLEDSSAILLRSKEVHSTFQALFEGLWQLAKPYSIQKT